MKKFTLIELLVVVAIIGILASMLLPSLQKARAAGKRAVCISNLKQIGAGMAMYHNDHDDFYPLHSNWGNMLGKQGTSGRYGGTTPANQRPLNQYVGDGGLVAKCPAERGDSLHDDITNCFDDIGTSYLVQWNGNSFAAAKVTDNDPDQLTRVTDWEKPTKKLILGDWAWHGNRRMTNSKTHWHSQSGRRFNILFADGHVSYFSFPMAVEGWLSKTPDSSTTYY